MKIASEFAYLDVKGDREELFRHFGSTPYRPCSERRQVPIVLHGYIDCAISEDDGVSRMYQIVITDLKQ